MYDISSFVVPDVQKCLLECFDLQPNSRIRLHLCVCVCMCGTSARKHRSGFGVFADCAVVDGIPAIVRG